MVSILALPVRRARLPRAWSRLGAPTARLGLLQLDLAVTGLLRVFVSWGLERESDAVAICTAGTFSNNGFSPCYSCPAGYYQSFNHSTSCVKCTDGTSTASEGARAESECLGSRIP